MTIDHLSDVTHALELADDAALQALDALPEHGDQIAAIRRQLAKLCSDTYSVMKAIAGPDLDRLPPALPPAPPAGGGEVFTRALPAAPAPAAPSPTTLASLAALERIADGIGALVEAKGAAPLPAPAAHPQRFAHGGRPPKETAPHHGAVNSDASLGGNLPTVGSADVAADIGIPTSGLTALLRSAGGSRVGLEVAGWVITDLGKNPGRSRLRWARAPQPADNSQGMESQQDL